MGQNGTLDPKSWATARAMAVYKRKIVMLSLKNVMKTNLFPHNIFIKSPYILFQFLGVRPTELLFQPSFWS